MHPPRGVSFHEKFFDTRNYAQKVRFVGHVHKRIVCRWARVMIYELHRFTVPLKMQLLQMILDMCCDMHKSALKTRRAISERTPDGLADVS